MSPSTSTAAPWSRWWARAGRPSPRPPGCWPGRRDHGGATTVAAEVAARMGEGGLTPGRRFLVKSRQGLPGGRGQRVAFARPLAPRPSVLLADEPVSMLDVSIRLEMLSLLDE